jgi:hypothetical protein
MTLTMDDWEFFEIFVEIPLLVFCMFMYIFFIITMALLFVQLSLEVFIATWNEIYFHDLTIFRVCTCENNS